MSGEIMEVIEKVDWLLRKGYHLVIKPVNLDPSIIHLRLEKNNKLMAHFSNASVSLAIDEAYLHIKKARSGK